jgi:hypothetical protein
VGRLGRSGHALELEYLHPRTAERVRIRQAVRIGRQEPFDLRVNAKAFAGLLGCHAERNALASALSPVVLSVSRHKPNRVR